MRYRSVFAFSFATLLSRIFGFVREGVVAYLLGASGVADAFYAALRVPALLRDLLAENAIQNAFIPSFIEAREKNNRPDVFLGTALLLWLSVAFVFSLIGVVAAPIIVKIMAYGFTGHPEKYRLAVQLVRVTSFYLFLVTSAAFASGLLNSVKSFFIPAVSPVLFNLGIITAGLISTKLTHSPPKYALAMSIGVIIGGLLQVVFLWPFVRKHDFKFSFRIDFHHEQLKKLSKLLVPVALSTGFSRLTLFVNTFVASFLGNGAIALLNYAFRIMNLPLGLFGVAISTVALPELAERAAREEDPSDVIARSFELVLMLALPSTLILILDADSIIAFLFERGSFTRANTYMSAVPLVLYALSVVPASMSKVLLGLYFSYGMVKRPNVAFAASALTNVLIAATISFKIGYPGLALATGLSAWVQFFILRAGSSRLFGFKKEHLAALARLLLVNLVASLAALYSIAHPHLGLKLRWLQDIAAFGVAYAVMFVLVVPEWKSILRVRK